MTTGRSQMSMRMHGAQIEGACLSHNHPISKGALYGGTPCLRLPGSDAASVRCLYGSQRAGYLPVVGMAGILMEIAPGVLINQVADAALKSANVRPGLMVVERHFGVLEFHSKAQAGSPGTQCSAPSLLCRSSSIITPREKLLQVRQWPARTVGGIRFDRRHRSQPLHDQILDKRALLAPKC